jgi:histidine triad (HIT) family protein
MSECVFCKIASGELEAEKIYENDRFFSIPDKNQKVQGHSLVISKEHFETVRDLDNESGNDLLDAIQKTIDKLSKEDSKIEGFNIINNCGEIAGQMVNHVHFHILPRRHGERPPIVY